MSKQNQSSCSDTLGHHPTADTSTKPPLIWLNVLVFSITFAVAAIGLPVYLYFYDLDLPTWLGFIIATGFCGMSITAGYHRLWSHRAYEAHPVIRFFYALGGAFAIQNSALHWSSDHRVHHRYVDDNDKDPYSARRGFWYSHIGWMLREYQAHRYHDYANVKDLKRDPIVVWQHEYYLPLVLLTNIGFPVGFGLINGNLLGSLLVIGVLRLVVSHHVTFLINSLAHMWGKQPYNHKNTAKDNALVALLTYGEGYHNFHHAFQYDYRNAIKWWQFDPTKWWIALLAKLGLAHNLKRVDDKKIAKAMAEQQLLMATHKLKQQGQKDADRIIALLHQEYEHLLQQAQQFYDAKMEILHAKKQYLLDKVDRKKLKNHYSELKRNWKLQQLQWQALVSQYA